MEKQDHSAPYSYSLVRARVAHDLNSKGQEALTYYELFAEDAQGQRLLIAQAEQRGGQRSAWEVSFLIPHVEAQYDGDQPTHPGMVMSEPVMVERNDPFVHNLQTNLSRLNTASCHRDAVSLEGKPQTRERTLYEMDARWARYVRDEFEAAALRQQDRDKMKAEVRNEAFRTASAAFAR